jgi:hypothetical protein
MLTHRDRPVRQDGGEGGIRTHGTVAHTPHFECGAFDLSATSPRSENMQQNGAYPVFRGALDD